MQSSRTLMDKGFNREAAKSMKLKDAQAILAHPKFGDPDCITAVERLKMEPEVQRLREALIGKKLLCWACEGRGKCNACGKAGKLTLDRTAVNGWEMDLLEEVAEELGIEC